MAQGQYAADDIITQPGKGAFSTDDSVSPTGRSKDNINSSVDATGKPYLKPTEGSAAGRAAGGFWDTTLGGLGKAAKMLYHAATPGPYGIPNHEALQDAQDLVQAHIDQYNKMKEAWGQGEHVEAFGHALGMIPLIGPAAAHAGERIGGVTPTLDKYGNVVQQGAAPDVAGGVGEGAGLAVSASPKNITQGVGKIAGTFPNKIPSSLNPKEAATVGFADQEDIPINLGTRTGNNVVKNAQGLVQNQPGGARYAQQATRSATDALSQTGDRLASSVSPTAVTAEQAGAGAAQSLQARISTLDAQADAAYGNLRSLENDPANIQKVQVGTEQKPVLNVQGRPIPGQMQTVPIMNEVALPVDMRPVKAAFRPVVDQMEQTIPLTQRDASPGYTALKNIMSGDDYVPASIADRNLSTIKAISRGAESPQLRNLSQGLAAKAIHDLEPEIQKAVSAANDQNALSYLKEGRQSVKNKYAVADLAKGLSDEPVQVFRRLTSNGDAYIDTLRDVQKNAPQAMAPIGRAYLQGLLDTASDQGGFSHADKLFADWNRLGPQTKGIIFNNPALVKNLDNFFFLAKRMNEVANPSKTAYVASLIPTVGLVVAQPHIGVPLVIGNAALSRLLFNPAAAKALASGLNMPAGTANAATVAGRIAALANATGVVDNEYHKSPPQFFRGGVIRRPTVLMDAGTGKPSGTMAERGPEAIVPLAAPDPLPVDQAVNQLSSKFRVKRRK